MSTEFAVALAVIGMSALILHYKSHVKFVALGVFVGLALIEIVPIDTYFTGPEAESVGHLALVLVPALVLGINHAVDKRKGNFVWTTLFVLVFTLFFLSSVGQLLPEEYRLFIMEQSIIAWQVFHNFAWIALAAAVMVLVDSIPHRHHVEKEKKKAKAKAKSKSKN